MWPWESHSLCGGYSLTWSKTSWSAKGLPYCWVLSSACGWCCHTAPSVCISVSWRTPGDNCHLVEMSPKLQAVSMKFLCHLLSILMNTSLGKSFLFSQLQLRFPTWDLNLGRHHGIHESYKLQGECCVFVHLSGKSWHFLRGSWATKTKKE